VSAVNGDGTFQVRWDEPDGGDEAVDLDPESMRRVTTYTDYQAGEAVLAKFPEDRLIYPAVVASRNANGTFTVRWDDPDGGPAESELSPKDIRYAPILFSSLKVGQKFTGVVNRLCGFGAFVDIGCETFGFLHTSMISEDRVARAEDALRAGQEAEVWVNGVDEAEGKFTLTMVEGKSRGHDDRQEDLGPFVGLFRNDWFDGEVSQVTKFGAFVRVTLPAGDSATGLLHITEVANRYVERMEDELDVGQKVKVRVMSVDENAGRMALSMKEVRGLMCRPEDFLPFETLDPDLWLDATAPSSA